MKTQIYICTNVGILQKEKVLKSEAEDQRENSHLAK